MKNGILVFELLDFVHKYINDFKIIGKDKLQAIREEIKKELEEHESSDIKLKDKIMKEGLKDSAINKINKRIEDRQKIRKYALEKWQEFENKMAETDRQINTIKGILTELDAYRDDAKNHIGSLSWAPLVSIVQENIDIVEDLKNIDWNLLVDFTIEDLYRLTGKNIDNEELTIN